MNPAAPFEQGPIRPPSEASSLLLRVNRNCPWNRCTFCSIYKKTKFSIRPVQDVINDIDTIHQIIEGLESGGGWMKKTAPVDEQAWYAARNWRSCGMKSVFLQDADCLTIRPENLVKILLHLRSRFPQVERVTAYARSSSVARIPDDTLKEIADAGLNRIHIGMETASDQVLALVRKGASKEIHVEAGLKVKRAGMELSEYFLVGLGGSEHSEEHALESADALNRINPDFIRFRTLHLPDRIRLFAGVEGADPYRWTSDLVQAREIHTLIANLDGITSSIRSDHSYNLFMEIDGELPGDKERLLGILRRFIGMPPELRYLYEVGKRTGHFVRLADLELAGRLEQVREFCRSAGITPENADQQLHDLVQERMRKGLPF